jgi:hypothetical protein
MMGTKVFTEVERELFREQSKLADIKQVVQYMEEKGVSFVDLAEQMWAEDELAYAESVNWEVPANPDKTEVCESILDWCVGLSESIMERKYPTKVS